MGYDVHITRASEWSDSMESPISLEEWTAHVEGDPDLRMDNVAEVTSPSGDVLRYENPGLAVWLGYSGRSEGHTPWFDLRHGRIVVKGPDEEILEKMRAIARALGGRVQGDDGELY